jgi:Monooxygenase af470-like
VAIFPGRFSAQLDGDFVVFLIGMRVNKPWKVRSWFPVFRAMPQMLRELERHPEAGLLHVSSGLIGASPVVVQYWRSFEQLERYARDADAEHFPAWKWFNQAVRGSGDVGIWHETYRVQAGDYEAIYGNMPRIGLARAGRHLPLGSTSTAARRLGRRPDDRAPVAGY